MEFVIAALILAGLAGVGYVYRRSSVDLKREVMVHTRDDTSLRGVLVASDAQYLYLENARYVNEGQQLDVEGKVRVPREQEHFTQLLGGE